MDHTQMCNTCYAIFPTMLQKCVTIVLYYAK